MNQLTWHVNGVDDSGELFIENGCENIENGQIRISIPVHGVTMRDVRGELPLEAGEEDRIFMNGYQTWTYSPEYSIHSSIRGVRGLPASVVDRFSLDRYSDYHFVPYLNRSGILHGFSWMTIRRGNHYRLIASLDETDGYTIFTYDAKSSFLYLKRDCMDVRFEETFRPFELFFAEGSAEEVYDAWFDAMGVKCLTDQKLFGYSSWYNRYQDIDEACVLKDLAGCRSILKEGDLFQVDDGWEPFIGDWLEPDGKKFPGGMKKITDEVHRAGMKAGLWLAPFCAEENSSVFREHPDWFFMVNGKPWKCGCNWSGFYALDIDNPEVRKYLSDVFRRVFDDWGFDLVKLDFLYCAATFGTKTESRAARMIRAMKWLRELCGDHLILGCGVPVMPAFGLVDYCRISCDVTLDWNDKMYMRIIHRERPSTKQAIVNTVTRYMLNGRAHLNDPDVFFLREENCRLSDRQKDLLARCGALLGGIWLTSDDAGSYTEQMKEKYAELRYLAENAASVRIDHSDGIRVCYVLDGEECSLQIKH